MRQRTSAGIRWDRADNALPYHVHTISVVEHQLNRISPQAVIDVLRTSERSALLWKWHGSKDRTAIRLEVFEGPCSALLSYAMVLLTVAGLGIGWSVCRCSWRLTVSRIFFGGGDGRPSAPSALADASQRRPLPPPNMIRYCAPRVSSPFLDLLARNAEDCRRSKTHRYLAKDLWHPKVQQEMLTRPPPWAGHSWSCSVYRYIGFLYFVQAWPICANTRQ